MKLHTWFERQHSDTGDAIQTKAVSTHGELCIDPDTTPLLQGNQRT